MTQGNKEECRNLVKEAFMNDPLTKGHNPSPEEISALVDDMIVNTEKYLPEGWK